VNRIVTFDGDLPEAHAPQSVTLTLDDEVDIVRGDLISTSQSIPVSARLFDATIVWLSEDGLDPQKRYRLKHTTRQEWAEVKAIHYAVNINTLAHEEASTLEMNQIGLVRLEAVRELYFDSYKENRGSGAFILIDPVTNGTAAAGMIVGAAREEQKQSRPYARKSTSVTPGERVARWKQRGSVIYLGERTALAQVLERALFDHGSAVVRFTEWDERWAPSLRSAGLIVLVTSAAAEPLRVVTADGEVDLQASLLPGDDEQSARAMFDVLERTQILLPAEVWTESDGI
jgi:hypothetical protein